MRTAEATTLPIAPQEYQEHNERTTRRTIEQTFQDTRLDIIGVRDTTTAPASLALRRHQFLLMGA